MLSEYLLDLDNYPNLIRRRFLVDAPWALLAFDQIASGGVRSFHWVLSEPLVGWLVQPQIDEL